MPGPSDPPSDDPWFRARVRGGAIEVDGTPACRLGHRISGHGSPDGDDGVFAEWRWDGTQLTVANDRYGLFPLFYYASDTEVAVSPSIVRLLELGAPRELDEDALAVFLRVGFYLEDETPFRAIRALPPNVHFCWQPGQLAVSGARPTVQAWSGTRHQALEAYIDLVAAAMARRLPPTSDFDLPLSGGTDSRHILLELVRQGRPPRSAVTVRFFPPLHADDVRLASVVCERLGVSHVVIPQRRSRVHAERRKNELTGFLADEHGWFLALADHLNGRTAYAFDGILGGVFGTNHLLREDRLAMLDQGEFGRAAASLAVRGGAALPGVLTATARTQLTSEGADARVAAVIQAHMDSPNPLGSMWFWSRTRRELSLPPYRLLRGVPTVFAPYLDHAVFDLIASLPTRLIIGGGFHRDAILMAFPGVADIPFSASLKINQPTAATARRISFDLARMAAGVRGGALVDRRRVARLFGGNAIAGRGGPLARYRVTALINLLQLDELVSLAA